MKIKTALLKRTAIVFLAVIFLLPLLSSIRPFKVSAVDNEIMPVDRAKIYTVFHYLKECISLDHMRWRDGISNAEISRGDVITRESFKREDTNVRVGFSFIPEGVSTNGNGYVECKESGPGQMLRAIEVDSLKFFTDDTGIFKSEASDYQNKINESDSVSKMKAAFETKFPHINFDQDMSQPMRYWTLLETFKKKCNEGEVESGGQEIKRVSYQTGEITVERRHVNSSGDKHSVGWGVPGSTNNERGFVLNCADIVKQLNETADAAAETTKVLLGRGIPPSTNTETTTDTESSNPKIDCSWSINPLTWLLCPLLDGAQNLINGIGGWIQEELDIDANKYFDENNDEAGQQIYTAWAYMRTISMALLVIIALVMVISQALGMEIVAAYTVKTVLPRIAIAVIAIALSWPLARLAVVFSNDLAQAVQAIIYSPFSSIPNAELNGLQVSAAAGAATVGGLALGIVGALSLVATAAVALFIAFIAIVLRQMLVILLVILAPLGILASILPNTQNWWKLWRETFSKSLLVYALITGFIAMGAVFGKIAGVNSDANGVQAFIALIATYAPYFLIPKAFTWAGGVVANIGGMVNDRGRGVFDRLRKGRSERIGKRTENFRNAGQYGSRNKKGELTRRARFGNFLGGMAFDPKDQSTLRASRRLEAMGISQPKALRKRAQHVLGKIESAKQEASVKWLQHVNSHGANDKFYRAMGGMYEGFQDETKERLVKEGMAEWKTDEFGNRKIVSTVGALRTKDQIDKMANILNQSESATERKGAAALMATAAYTDQKHLNSDIAYADTAYGAALGLASHGFFDGRDAEAMGHAMEMTGAETGYIHAAAASAEVEVAKRGHAEAKAGYGHVIDKDGHIVDGLSPTSDRGFAVAKTLGVPEYSGFKGGVLAKKGPDGKLAPARYGAVVSDILNVNQGGERKQAVINKWGEEFRKAGYSDIDAAAAINDRLRMCEDSYEGTKGAIEYLTSDYFQGGADVKAEALAVLQSAGLPPKGGMAYNPETTGGPSPPSGGSAAGSGLRPPPPPAGGGLDLGGPSLN